MRFTLITEENARYFETAIGELFREQRNDRLFFGVIDEEDEGAAGAASFAADGDTLWIDTIGVTDEKRRRGFGSFLLKKTMEFAKDHGFRRLAAAFYEEEDKLSGNELAKFFGRCGFDIAKVPVERQVYSVGSLAKAESFLIGEEREGYTFRKGSELDEKEREELIGLALREEGGIPYLDEELVFSEKNRFGGVLFKDGAIVAAATIVPFEEGARLDQLHGRLTELTALRILLMNCLEEMKKEKGLKKLYMDVGGEKLLDLQKKSFEKAGIACERQMTGYVAQKGTGEA